MGDAMSDARERPIVDQLGYEDDPAAAIKAMRELSPVGMTEIGMPFLIEHAAVRRLLGDTRLRANFVQVLGLLGITEGPFHDWMAVSPLNHDGAEHKQWRAMISRTFTPRSVEQVRPFLASAADELAAAFATKGSCEFMVEFADVLPALGLSELIGVPAEDRERFRQWALVIGHGFRPIELIDHIDEVDAALAELLEYCNALVEQRRDDPRDDLVSRMAAQIDGEEGYGIDEMSMFVGGLVFAGNDTTRNQLGWSINELSKDEALWDAVGTGELPVAAVVEECLRYRSAVSAIGRGVTEQVDVGDDALPAGSLVLLSIFGANHDPEVFPNPEQLDPVGNANHPHLSFGHGPHHCIGASLARAELQEGIRAVTAAIRCPVVGADAEWSAPVGINGPRRLPLTFEPRS